MFRKPTVDSVLASFENTIRQLEAIVARSVEEGKAANLEAARQLARADRIEKEKDRAREVALKLRALIK